MIVYIYHSIAGYVYNIIKASVVCMTCALIMCAADTNDVVGLVNAARGLPTKYPPEGAYLAQVMQILPCSLRILFQLLSDIQSRHYLYILTI